MCSENKIYIKVTSREVYPAFLYYYLLYAYENGEMRYMQEGTQQQFIRQTDILNYRMGVYGNRRLSDFIVITTVEGDSNISLVRVGDNAGEPRLLKEEHLL